MDNKSRLTVRADVSSTFLKASMTMYQNGQLPMYMLTWPGNRQWQSGIAAHYSRRIDSSLQLQITARTDFFDMKIIDAMGKSQLEVFGYNNTDKTFFLPAASVQLTKKLLPKLSASLAVSVDSRTPTASELYGFYLFNQFDGYDYIGNVNLKTERSQKAEATLAWQSLKWKLQATGYIAQITNYILGDYAPDLQVMTIGARGVKVYQNIPQAMLAGGEASAIVRPMKQMLVISTLKYAYAKDASNKPLPLITPLRNITSIRQEWNKFWLATEFEAAAAQNRVRVEAAEKQTGAFSLWHVRAGYKIKGSFINWEINAGVENILNAYYREHLDWGNLARPGRNFFVQLTAAF